MTDLIKTPVVDSSVIAFTSDAEAMKEAALSSSALVSRVKDKLDQDIAVAAQANLQAVLSAAEKAREAAKKPWLETGRKIDAVAKAFRVEIDVELVRVAKLVGDFQTLELAKIRAAEQALRDDLDRLERERQEALAKASTHEELEKVQEEHAQRVLTHAASIPPPEQSRATGQVVREDWVIEVVNPLALAMNHPQCVKIEPRLSEIKLLLDQGIQVAGVKASKQVTSSVRSAKSNLLVPA